MDQAQCQSVGGVTGRPGGINSLPQGRYPGAKVRNALHSSIILSTVVCIMKPVVGGTPTQSNVDMLNLNLARCQDIEGVTGGAGGIHPLPQGRYPGAKVISYDYYVATFSVVQS